MKNFLRKTAAAVPLFAGILAVALLTTISCNGNDDGGKKSTNPLNITKVILPSVLYTYPGAGITLSGQGFLVKDKVEFIPGTGDMLVSEITSATDTNCSFKAPSSISSGSYGLKISRGDDELSLGNITVAINADVDIPDKEGMSVKGIVSCEGKGLPGVVVSDGYEVTKTDENGIYYLASEKQNGYVFISLPSGYITAENGNTPIFYKNVNSSRPKLSEEVNFQLIKEDNSNYVLIAMADFHLADRCSDLNQYTDVILPDINSTIAKYEAEGKKVYGLTLGDLSWDIFWYSNSFAPATVKTYINKINCPVFNCTGNHDNDPYVANDDWQASVPYFNSFGPTYYSFNLGPVHYIVLDNIVYINTGGSEGKVGERNYDCRITDSQIEWLKKDLATLPGTSTPVVVAMHAPLYKRPYMSGASEVNVMNLKNSSDLVEALASYEDVTILTGHVHTNYSTVTDNLREHNVAAICATWWWTGYEGYAGNYICKDGSPAGYDVWEISSSNGSLTKVNSYYKSAGYDAGYQFRTYDLNNVYISADKFLPDNKSKEDELADYVSDYGISRSDNKVLINIFNYNTGWKVDVTENGEPLSVARVDVKDPLHIISYETQRLNHGATPTSDFLTGNTSHMFEVTASSGSSTLIIKVTDDFGNVYTETMTRPKGFNTSMK
ncbi:MAG: calcineurin-like phosphoesterase family protein [Bacteroidales bacterium]|jgi:hypothetical protein|nr:calcineurin-like phosphoesterase family protein [Bacteroidales bacterium]